MDRDKTVDTSVSTAPTAPTAPVGKCPICRKPVGHLEKSSHTAPRVSGIKEEYMSLSHLWKYIYFYGSITIVTIGTLIVTLIYCI